MSAKYEGQLSRRGRRGDSNSSFLSALLQRKLDSASHLEAISRRRQQPNNTFNNIRVARRRRLRKGANGLIMLVFPRFDGNP